jgi:hypothetical protein
MAIYRKKSEFMNHASAIEYLPVYNGPVIRLNSFFNDEWVQYNLEKLLKVATLWNPYTTPDKLDKVSSLLVQDFSHIPPQLIEQIRKLIELQWGVATKLARCYLNQAKVSEITPPHRDMAGSLKGYTAVIFMKASDFAQAELTFLDEGPDPRNVVVTEKVGDMIVFPSHLLHQQGRGVGRTTLVLNFLE